MGYYDAKNVEKVLKSEYVEAIIEYGLTQRFEQCMESKTVQWLMGDCYRSLLPIISFTELEEKE